MFSMDTQHCYSSCDRSTETQNALKCEICNKYFHIDCLKSGRPSPLIGDIFFNFKCSDCCETKQEEFDRMKLPWLPAVVLALYNLQVTNTGRQGYFRWKEHICSFIEKHWTTLFGGRKKTHTWFGTVAGALSNGCPEYFLSGTKELQQSGWWKLTNNSPPPLEIMKACPKKKKLSTETIESVSLSKPSGLRYRTKQSAVQAAIDLKAKRNFLTKKSSVTEFLPNEGGSLHSTAEQLSEQDEVENMDLVNDECDSLTTELSHMSSCSYSTFDCLDQSSQMSKGSCVVPDGWLTEKDLIVGDKVPECLLKEDEDDDDDDLDIDLCTMSPGITTFNHASDSLPPLEDILSCLSPPVKEDCDQRAICIKAEDLLSLPCNDNTGNDTTNPLTVTNANNAISVSGEEDNCDLNEKKNDNSPDGEASDSIVNAEETTWRRKRHLDVEDELPSDHSVSVSATSHHRLVLMSLYEEKQLLKKFRMLDESVQLDPSLRRLRRKLLVRQQQREHGTQIFDIDVFMNQLDGVHRRQKSGQADARFELKNKGARDGLELNSFSEDFSLDDVRILDRYQMTHLPYQKPQPTSFINRLVGVDSNDLTYIYSPYTTRSLKPFIRRDFESRPLKLRLIEELLANTHRKEPGWKSEPLPPIDYCYVRPQHIPSVNALCKEFFWPGIDLSESLQYPDFSCVALYRMFVVGFAFMVPDVKYNEAYISFIFTHPEWRRAGIASFMLYHLIQMSSGKEITLHVSASNPALLLYQKFGFKEEEFILDFYDKYFPLESTECRHALFMRLRR